ncbi:MAG: response regulator [Anaerolineae bacterium]|nr:response regulator [Anaerolineae bacterium]
MTTTVMLVDDTMFMRRMLRDILSREGFEIVAEAKNGREAVDLYRQVNPHMVIMDITMPEMDGIVAVREIISTHPTARIVMCSALNQEELIIEALEMGALDFVIKPFVPEKVMEAVNKALALSQE